MERNLAAATAVGCVMLTVIRKELLFTTASVITFVENTFATPSPARL